MSYKLNTEGIRKDEDIRTRDTFGTERPIYLRNGGDDDNDGSSVALAVASYAAALALFDYADQSSNTRQYVEMTGYTTTLPFDAGAFGQYGMSHALPNSARAAPNVFRAGAFDDGKQDYLGYPIEFYADPVLVVNVTVDSYTMDPDTSLPVANVNAGTPLVPGAHAGHILVGGLAEFGCIHSNTASTITFASNFVGSVGALGIYTQGCTINMATLFGLTLIHNGPVAFNGIKFTGGIVRSWVSVYSFFQMCYFEGGFYTDGMGGICNALACYFEGGRMQLEGCAMELKSCVLQGVEVRGHGSGGNGRNTLSYCILDGCTPYGAGNFESSFDIEVEFTHIVNGTGDGIQILSPQQCRLSDTRIDDCAGNGVSVVCGGGVCRMDDMSGTGNALHGLLLVDGAQCQTAGTNTLDGDLGETKIGASAVSSWSDGERTDVLEISPQFCRIY